MSDYNVAEKYLCVVSVDQRERKWFVSFTGKLNFVSVYNVAEKYLCVVSVD